MIQFTLPLKLESLANAREHWTQKMRRARAQRDCACGLTYTALENLPQVNALLAAIGHETIKHPKRVTITRVGKRKLDSDNLAISAKHVRDGIADALGVDDGDETKVQWHYKQEIGKEYKVFVEIK